MMNKHSSPIRSCIICGSKRKKQELIRLVLDEKNQLIQDFAGKMQGRGAYVCDDRSCQERLHTYKGFYKIFRTDKRVRIRYNIDSFVIRPNGCLPNSVC